ncbi:FKBP-type peptidylprolyl isomerase [Salinarchaeum sp. Harcht-Bsk1]|uniref:FKBP-type peptidyl-prolyl cis-trans isomerase n=1 Tax=Salinarchaeum sp. Harcht-Bsk1 TaxID=1333523 RepID=UPI0003423898|nr:peptidylprolyl isomerase [Salinarchaeum sp. Harcht-Bsk1]AGN01141.1 FKBP-type peptidylprolyl isomerase [Salinarchaeum sp. Harcht-Bsk1]
MTEDDAEAAEDAAEEAAEAEAEDNGDEESGLQEGDFVRLSYTARETQDGGLVDTTSQEVAEEEGVADEDQTFEPRIIVLGEGHLFEPVEEAIKGQEEGDSGTVTVPAEEAFGEKDPEQVRTVAADKVPEDERYPGAHVQIDGEHGHVEAIIGGRARVDFNHALAGRDIEYEYEILDVVDDRLERAQGLVNAFLDIDLEMWFETDEVEEETYVSPSEEEGEDEDTEGDEDEDVEGHFETELVEKESLYIEATPQLTMNQQWMMGKQQIAQQLIDRLGIDRVVVQETIDGMGAGPMGGMMGGMGGGGEGDIEDALEDADVDADELVEELEDDA